MGIVISKSLAAVLLSGIMQPPLPLSKLLSASSSPPKRQELEKAQAQKAREKNLWLVVKNKGSVVSVGNYNRALLGGVKNTVLNIKI